LASLVLGIEMTDKNLQKVFGQFGVKKFGAVGEPFDPTLHDALFQIPDASRPAGSIGQILKHGYKLKDRVIRAAQVGTIVKPED
jgi:molecular chaperone GrpE